MLNRTTLVSPRLPLWTKGDTAIRRVGGRASRGSHNLEEQHATEAMKVPEAKLTADVLNQLRKFDGCTCPMPQIEVHGIKHGAEWGVDFVAKADIRHQPSCPARGSDLADAMDMTAR
jgi:hypothetical protein